MMEWYDACGVRCVWCWCGCGFCLYVCARGDFVLRSSRVGLFVSYFEVGYMCMCVGAL